MRRAILIVLAAGLFFLSVGCISRTDEDGVVKRTFVLPTLSIVTECTTDTAKGRTVLFMPLVISRRTCTETNGAETKKLFIAPLATMSESKTDKDGRRSSLFVSIPLLTVKRGWVSADGESYFKKTQSVVFLYGSTKSRDIDGVESRSWFLTPFIQYRRYAKNKTLRLFFIPIPLFRDKATIVPD